MNCYYRNILSYDECTPIANEMFNLLRNDQLSIDVTPYTNGSLGAYNLESTLSFVERIEKSIRINYGDNIEFENTFTRIYQNGNDLKIHTDRPGLDITLSVCLYTNLDWDWPIFVSTRQVDGLWNSVIDPEEYKKDYEIFYTPVGSGVACLGTKSPHWRDPLVCKNDQYMIQTFYHWRYK